jgi:amino acid transporter
MEVEMTTEATPAGRPTLFTRQATGLVREVGGRDALLLNLFWINLPLGFFIMVVAPAFFPGVNVPLGIALTTLILVIPILMYSWLASAMPRAGGEYVYISRIIHPALGFVAGLGITLTFVMITSMYAAWMAVVALSPVCAALGTVLDSSSLTSLSATLSEQGWQFVVGVVAILACAVLNLYGWRIVLKVMRVIAVLLLITFLIMAILMATNSTSDFASSFSQYGSYDGVISAAQRQGFGGSTSMWSFLPLGFTLLGIAQFAAYTGGEIKAPARNMAISMVGGLLVAGAVMTGMAALANHAFGSDFLGSMTFVAGTHAYPSSLPDPFLFLYIVMLTDNTPVLILISLGWITAIFAGMYVLFVVCTRNFLAFSLDRILPGGLGEVNPTFHTPVRITALIAALAIGILAVFVWGPVELFNIQFSGTFLYSIVFFFASLAAVLFAYRASALFAASPFHKRVGGVPVIALLGAGAMIEYAYFGYKLATDDAIGANINSGMIAVAILLGIGIPIYLISYAVQRRNGVDITLASRELPPE